MCGTNTDCGCATPKDEKYGFPHIDLSAPGALGQALLPDPALLTAAAPDEATGLPGEWHAVLTVEGLRTTDHRRIAPEALNWRQLPIVIFAQFLNAGHSDASIVGKITEITREPWNNGMSLIKAKGMFDLGSEAGREAARQCKEQILRWGSIDLEVLESQYVEVSMNGGSGGDLISILFDDDETSIGETDWYDEVTNGRIMGFTMVAMPAFPQAVVAPIDVELDIPDPMGEAAAVSVGLLASAIPTTPPTSWFADPQFSEVTPLTVTEDGRVFGHLALWDTCHTGFDGVCIVPPRSQQDYAYFCTGRLKTSDGSDVRVGQITFDTGHAGPTLDWRDTTFHYDNTGCVAADVSVGEDDFGIWFSGGLRPGITDEQLRVIKASPLSGDWRKIGHSGGLELVAALAVNVPGFPIVASAGRRGTEQVSLIAASVKQVDPLVEMARQLSHLRRAIAPLLNASLSQLSERVNGQEVIATDVVLSDLVKRVNMGGKPNPGTKKDRRLKENDPLKKAKKAAVK